MILRIPPEKKKKCSYPCATIIPDREKNFYEAFHAIIPPVSTLTLWNPARESTWAAVWARPPERGK